MNFSDTSREKSAKLWSFNLEYLRFLILAAGFINSVSQINVLEPVPSQSWINSTDLDWFRRERYHKKSKHECGISTILSENFKWIYDTFEIRYANTVKKSIPWTSANESGVAIFFVGRHSLYASHVFSNRPSKLRDRGAVCGTSGVIIPTAWPVVCSETFASNPIKGALFPCPYKQSSRTFFYVTRIAFRSAWWYYIWRDGSCIFRFICILYIP